MALFPNKANKAKKTNYNYIEARENPNSYTTESIQKMVVNLEYANVDKSYKVIQVTSTLSGEGKTTLVGNLSYLLSQKYKVLVVDMDLRKPKIHRIVNDTNQDGLTDYLLDVIPFEQLIKNYKNGLDYIVGGQKTSSVNNVLNSKKLEDLISKLKERYDYIILDTPPVQVNADALIVSKLADGVVYVVGYNIVKKVMIHECIDSLKRQDVNLLGIAFTQVKLPKRRSLYHYYYYDAN